MRGLGLGLWLARTLLISVFFPPGQMGDLTSWSKEKEDGSKTQENLADAREENCRV